MWEEIRRKIGENKNTGKRTVRKNIKKTAIYHTILKSLAFDTL